MTEIRQSETVVIRRSQINFAPYNPKKHSREQVREQLSNFKRVGFLGGIVWNEVTGNLISGHKRVMAYDLYYGNDGTEEKGYDIKVEKVHMDAKTEKEQNIYMDSHNTNTEQDYDLLAQLIPDIDYRNAGLTAADLQFIGIDLTAQTEGERGLGDDLDELYSPVRMEKEATAQQRKEDIKAKKEASNEKISGEADNLNSYVVINFDSYKDKSAFMIRFGFNPMEKFIVGSVFENMIERVE